jgi:hypothetical protein
MSAKVPRKRNGLYSLAIVLLVLAGVAGIMGLHNPMIRSLGGAGVLASLYLLRRSRASWLPPSYVPIDQNDKSDAGMGLERIMRIVGIALIPLLGVSFFYLHQDALHGYHEVLPVYVFAGVGLACALVWSYLVSKSL